jgi:hypothetical protein
MDTSVKNISAEMRAAVIVDVLLGFWVVVSPFALGVPAGSVTMWNNVAVGAAVIVVALIGGWKRGAVLGVIVPLSAWLFASTFILNFFDGRFLGSNVISAFALIAEAAYGGALSSMPSPHAEGH